MAQYVHSSLIYHRQKLERTKIFNRGMDTENVFGIFTNGAIKNNAFMKYLGKHMKLLNIILRELTNHKRTHMACTH